MSTSVDMNHPGIRVLISRSPRPIHEAVRVSGIDPSPQVVNNAGVGTWRSLVAHLNGVQGVGGSNPLVPTSLFKGLAVPYFPVCNFGVCPLQGGKGSGIPTLVGFASGLTPRLLSQSPVVHIALSGHWAA